MKSNVSLASGVVALLIAWGAMSIPAIDKMVFRKTNAQLGRHISVSPVNSTNKHLAYGRIILNSISPSASLSNGGRETAFICLSGSADVSVGSDKFCLKQYDGLYIPRDSHIEVRSEGQADIAEFSADVGHHYALQFIRKNMEIKT